MLAYSYDCLKTIPTCFPHVNQKAQLLVPVISRYTCSDIIRAFFCLNLWRGNRSSLEHSLVLNEAIVLCNSFGSDRIDEYAELEALFNEITQISSHTPRDDYIIDDYGEVFINHLGKSYPVITGTGHSQTYAALRFMQTIALEQDHGEDLTTLLDYTSYIINNTRAHNTPVSDRTISVSLPSPEFWDSIKHMFDSPCFNDLALKAAQIMGYQIGPIDIRHYVNKESMMYPLCNLSILIDYYHLLLSSAEKTGNISNHIGLTLMRILENSFNFSPESPNRVLIRPAVLNEDTKQKSFINEILFAAPVNDTIFIALSEKNITSGHDHQIIADILQMQKKNNLAIIEQHYRKEFSGSYAIKATPDCPIEFLIFSSKTDVTVSSFDLGPHDEFFHCSALDLVYFIGFSNNLQEVLDFIHFSRHNKTGIFTFGGKSNLYFTWRDSNKLLSSGAVEYTEAFIDYNETEESVLSVFKNNYRNFPHHDYGLFADPLNWNTSEDSLGYDLILHKGCQGFGGKIKRLPNDVHVFITTNVEFFTEQEFDFDQQTALNLIEEIVQRQFNRYCNLIGTIPILHGKTLQILYMPLQYAETLADHRFLMDSSKVLVYSNEFVDADSIIIRYTVKKDILFSKMQASTDRSIENLFFVELLRPLFKYAPKELITLEKELAKDNPLKKTVDVFSASQDYYFCNMHPVISIPPESFARVRKDIAQICLASGVAPGEYTGKEATSAIRKMQLATVQLFESHIAQFDQLEIHKKTLCYFSVQQHGVILNRIRYSTFSDLEDAIQKEFQKETRAKRERLRNNVETAEYLIESNLAVEHCQNAKPLANGDFEYLLAFSDWLVVLQHNADTCYYTDADVTISIDSEYRVDTIQTSSFQKRYSDLIERKYQDNNYKIKNDETDNQYCDKALTALSEDIGLDFKLMLLLLDYMQLTLLQSPNISEVYPNVFKIQRRQLENMFYADLEKTPSSVSVISPLVDYLCISPQELKTYNGKKSDILPIWEREKRSNRFSTRPLLAIGDDIFFSPTAIHTVLNSWKSGILDWYLPYEIGLSRTLAVLKEWKKRYENAMVQDVANHFKKHGFDVVTTELDLYLRFPSENYPSVLGDYDVLAINTKSKQIWIIESKVLQKVGSTYEYHMQQKSFFRQHKDDEKFQRRIDYMSKNAEKVLTSFHITEKGYSVIPYMVVNKLFFSAYKEISFPIKSFGEFITIINTHFPLADDAE